MKADDEQMSTGFAAAPSSTEDDLAEERALRDITRQIVLAYPWASPAHVETILRANFEATRDARVQNYRLVLAERDTRVHLRREAPSTNPLETEHYARPA